MSSTTHQYFCDLCGTVTSPAELNRLRDERVLSTDRKYRSSAADVCRNCLSQPLSVLLAVIAKKRQLKEESAR